MAKNEKKQTSEVAITPVTETKVKQTPPLERKYQIAAIPSLPPKGKQRQIVLAALNQDPTRAYSVDEVTEFATAAGLSAVGGIKASCNWHLHQMNILGIVKVTNPTVEVTVAVKPNTKAEVAEAQAMMEVSGD